MQDEIIAELAAKYGISKTEVAKVVSSQFRVIENIVTNKECKTINCKGLGKFYPTAYRKKLEGGKTGGNS